MVHGPGPDDTRCPTRRYERADIAPRRAPGNAGRSAPRRRTQKTFSTDPGPDSDSESEASSSMNSSKPSVGGLPS